VLAKRFIASPNVWPPEEQLPRSDFREPLEAYYEAMLSLAGVVLDLVAATLPYGPHVFDGFTDNNPACPLRLLHYPPTKMPVAGELPQLGSSAHTDFGAITLLLQDEHEGLEVLDQATGEWHLLPPRKDAYVVNLGDMMSKMTAGHYKSSMHRVINRNKTDRYSVVFFFDGNRDFKLKPLGTTDVDEKETMTAEEYMYERINFTYRHENEERS
jgi:isopenicillin N synthase-like dioxygenase